ncbi:MAG: ABC transporter ATP-binding protein [Chitinispirillaceae bacterium]|nr:ABC transporter ATP-binding protein [Chitinispirillaceae bacterium]
MQNVKLYRRMFRYVLVYWPLALLSVVLSFLVVNLEAISLWFSASLVQTLFKPAGDAVPPVHFSIATINETLKYYTWLLIRRENPLDSLKVVCLLMAAAFFSKNLLIYVKALIMAQLNLRIVRDMRNQLFGHALRLPVTYYDRSRSGNIISLVINDVSAINESMTGTFDKLFSEPMRVLFFVSMLFIINAKLTLAVFIVFPVLGFCIVKIGQAVRRRSKRVLESIAGLLSILHETVAGIRAVKMFNMDGFESEKFKSENSRFVHRSFRSVKISAVVSPLTEVLGVIVVIILLWYGGQQVLKSGGFGAEDFVRFLIFLFSVFTPLKTLGNINNLLQRGFAAADRVFSILDSPVEPVSTLVPDAVPSFNDAVRVSHVDFTYPGCDEVVLHDIDFTLKKGSVIALVGSSGSGKSTLLDLLPRFYPVSAGAITIDGVSVNDMDLAGLRSLFGIVSQETVLFNETVRNNIAYGLTGATKAQVVDAAKAAQAWEFIEKMPQGLDTVIGERGVMLSGGQRQRLAIARALLRNPAVLILDEATSSLDTESERLVQDAIDALMKDRTALVVAHRLSTVRHADCILVLDNGRIVEQGTHEELLQLNKRYKYLHDIQFAVRDALA